MGLIDYKGIFKKHFVELCISHGDSPEEIEINYDEIELMIFPTIEKVAKEACEQVIDLVVSHHSYFEEAIQGRIIDENSILGIKELI